MSEKNADIVGAIDVLRATHARFAYEVSGTARQILSNW
jgi:hypothetical protein